MAWTYILRCRDGSFYTGSTDGDLDARVWQHNHDEQWAARFTIKRRPLMLVYAEQFATIDAAFYREKQIQGWSRAKKVALIEGRGAELPELSRSRKNRDASTGPATQEADRDASTGPATQEADRDASTGSATHRRFDRLSDPTMGAG